MTRWRDKAEFKEKVRAVAKEMNVEIQNLALRPMKNKWASCSTDGNLNFNIQLLDLEKGLGDYVIVHELLHFSVPNHGKLWKCLMTAYLGDYEIMESQLKKIAAEEA